MDIIEKVVDRVLQSAVLTALTVAFFGLLVLAALSVAHGHWLNGLIEIAGALITGFFALILTGV